MPETTLCYIKKGDYYLMMHRILKPNDYNHNKWIGVGGKIENETVKECLYREVLEETGLVLRNETFFGHVFFHDGNYYEHMYLYVSEDYEGTVIESSEGVLDYIHKDDILNLELWEGDILFLKKILANEPFTRLDLFYEKGHLIRAEFKDTL